MKARTTLLIIFSVIFSGTCFAQITQTIRGKVIEKESKTEMAGVNVVLTTDTAKKTGTTTDMNGYFRLDNVVVGRHSLKFSFIGYSEVSLSNIIVDAGKEVVLVIEMEEQIATKDEVIITANKSGESANEMSSGSTRSFTIEETNRYAGSRSDPARMASNFAGVQGADDSRNDIVIRGNSPMGLLWKVEGIDIPNPNHFAVPGTTGGAISVLNNKIFGQSDFMTGAFSAEFGNANAGVFDIRLRNGNNEKYEFTGQLGFLGTEFSAEGPLSKTTGSSFLLTYRYSTLKLFESFNIKLGTSAVPSYQDASFKLNFPTKKGAYVSLFGIGGISDINIMLSDKSIEEVEIYGDSDRDQRFSTSMGLLGASWSKSLNEKSYLKFTLAAYGSDVWAMHDKFKRDSVYALDTLYDKMNYRYLNGKYSLNFSLTKKYSARWAMKTGMLADYIRVDLIDSNFVEATGQWSVRNDYRGSYYLVQPFVQWKYKKTDNLSFNFGIHAMYLGLNGSFSIEPRAGVKYLMKNNQSLSFSAGMHSQMQPTYIYFNQVKDTAGKYALVNKDLGFTRSLHAVLGYDKAIGQNARLKIEAYYQYLYEVPVDTFSSSFSLVNQGSTFSRFFPGKLVNEGTANNYGLELTIEKFFSKSYYYMITASYYSSMYRGSDGVLRNTDFNGTYATNALIGREFTMGKRTVLSTGTKITWAGGKRYTRADTAASSLAGELVEIDSLRNQERFNDYFRWDVKVGIKINTKKVTHEIALDLVNVLNTRNVLGLTYAPDPANPSADPIKKEYQLGFLPLFYYKIDF
ncbi:MAG: carboxypeptidase-like regulatory domain-containing protein [Bacteroidota bacterium]